MTKLSYASKKDVKEGTRLIADGRFTCIKEGEVRVVQKDENGELYVPCNQGRHYLSGQLLYDEGCYIGFHQG